MADVEVTRESCALSWKLLFGRACEHDTWGQMDEALELYQHLLSNMHTESAALSLVASESTLVREVVGCITARVTALKAAGVVDGINSTDMKMLGDTVFPHLFRAGCTFPPELRHFAEQGGGHMGAHTAMEVKRAATTDVADNPDDADEGVDGSAKAKGKLLAPLTGAGTKLEVIIDRIGLKDAESYIDPFITISVINASGGTHTTLTNTTQSTGAPVKRRPQYINFGCVVHLQTLLEDMEHGWAILFEFKHYKPKKKKDSTRCWCFIEYEDIKPGQQALELYKKPADLALNMSKLKLHTIKSLFLHVDLKFIK